MITVLSIIFITSLAALGISYLVKYISYSEPEEHLPVENYDLLKKSPIKTKKVTKSKTKK
jgi:hypothetical protein